MICDTTSCGLFVYCIWECYSGILYQNCVLVLTICKDFFADCNDFFADCKDVLS